MQHSKFFPRRHLALSSRGVRPISPRGSLRVWAAKGFGGSTASKSDPYTQASSKKAKMKKSRERNSNPMAPAGPSPNSIEARFLEGIDKAKSGDSRDEEAFKKRLASLKRKAEAVQKESAVSGSAPEGFSPLDSPVEPPKEVKEEGSSGLGIPQLAVGVLSLLLAGVFLVTSGPGGGGPTPPPASVQEQSSDAKKAKQTRLEEVEQRVKADSKDLDSKRELASIAASLGNYQRSKALSEEVVKEDANDSASWLQLGEARSQLGDLKGAATAFEKSLETTTAPTTQLLQGLAGVLVNDKRYEEAVQKLQSFESVAGKSEALGAVDLKLLIAKVYSQWDRHFSNALEVYDGIINDYPNDYRGFLARGALLKQNGRNADAQRMFIKARFFSPPEARAVVEGVINR